MNPRKEYRNSTTENSTQNTTQRRNRQHTGLRSLDAHFSAEQVYRACHVPYPGTDVLREKDRQRARASSDRARSAGVSNTEGPTATGDRSGESGVSLW